MHFNLSVLISQHNTHIHGVDEGLTVYTHPYTHASNVRHANTRVQPCFVLGNLSEAIGPVTTKHITRHAVTAFPGCPDRLRCQMANDDGQFIYWAETRLWKKKRSNKRNEVQHEFVCIVYSADAKAPLFPCVVLSAVAMFGFLAGFISCCCCPPMCFLVKCV